MNLRFATHFFSRAKRPGEWLQQSSRSFALAGFLIIGLNQSLLASTQAASAPKANSAPATSAVGDPSGTSSTSGTSGMQGAKLAKQVSLKPHAGTSAKATSKRTHPSAAAKKQSALGPAYGGRADVIAFADELAGKGLDRAWLLRELAQARQVPAVQRLIMPAPAGTAKNWTAYKARFVEPKRIQAGLDWWQANAEWLDKAERQFGVPADMVVAIVGVETFYGRITGTFRVLDALATLSFDFPTGRSDRSPFFRSELAAFLRWCAQEQRDPASVRGSFAGAIGLPQFMPGSILNHAIDFDGDGRIRLEDSPADVIGSVANFFVRHGWISGLPTHFAFSPPDDSAQRQLLLEPDLRGRFSVSEIRQAGGRFGEQPSNQPSDALGPFALVQLENGPDAAPEYLAASRNFITVTRYNWSSYYAMAVIELAKALSAARQASSVGSTAQAR